MKWFLRFCFLLAFAVLPVMAHANPLPLPLPLPAPPRPVHVAPEFDLATISGGLAASIAAGWFFLGRPRRNRRD
jgi:hypothetical protein